MGSGTRALELVHFGHVAKVQFSWKTQHVSLCSVTTFSFRMITLSTLTLGYARMVKPEKLAEPCTLQHVAKAHDLHACSQMYTV